VGQSFGDEDAMGLLCGGHPPGIVVFAAGQLLQTTGEDSDRVGQRPQAGLESSCAHVGDELV
jgi:hypothetical protein